MVFFCFEMVDLSKRTANFLPDQNQSGGVNGWEEPSRFCRKVRTMTSTRGFRSPFFIFRKATVNFHGRHLALIDAIHNVNPLKLLGVGKF
jgi:hypothetical protein